MTLSQIRNAILLILGLTLVIASVAYSSVLQRGYVVVKFSALLIGATALLSLGTYLLAIGRRWKELKDPLLYLMLAEIGVLLLSVATSGQSWISLLGSMPRLMGTLTIASFVVAGLALVLAVGEDRNRLLLVLRVVAATAVASSLNTLYEWPKHPAFRPPGLVGNAEFLSNYLLIGALASLALVFTEKSRRWAWLGIVGAAVTGVGMSVAKTRGAWLGYGAGIAVLLLTIAPYKLAPEILARGRRRMLYLCSTAFGVASAASLWGFAVASHPMEWELMLPFLPAFGLLFLATPWFMARLRFVRHALLALLATAVIVTGFSVSTQTAILPFKVADALRITQESARGVVRDDTIGMLKKYGLLGCGIENYRVAFLEFKSERLARADPRVNYRNPHNMLLYEWTTNGLAGVLVFLGLLVFGIWGLLVARRRELTTGWGLFASAILATLAGYHVHNFFNYDVIPTGLHYYVLLGMTVVLHRTAGRKDEDDDNGDDKAPADTPDEDDAESEDDDAEQGASKKKAASKKKGGAKKDASNKKGGAKKDASKKKGGAKKDARKTARKAAKKVARKTARLAEAEGHLWSRQALWLAVGLIGATALYLLLHQWPSIRDHFRFIIGMDLPSRKDGLAAMLIVAWGGGWAAAGLLQSEARTKARFLLTGLLGLIALYAAFYAIPTLREALAETPEEGHPIIRNDILPAILILSWAGFWTIVGLSADLFDQAQGPGSEDDIEADALAKSNSWALALLLASIVGVGAWWAGRHLKADYHMFRAHAVSRTARARTIGQIQRIDSSLRQITRMRRQLQRQGGNQRQMRGLAQRQERLRRQQLAKGAKLKVQLHQVQKHGRIAANAVGMLGYYHFQYSKALHPFLKARSVLDNYKAVVAESLAHARKSVKQNTNPESAFSHLSVVYLAAGKLQMAKKALAQSIAHDPYYYDTHRMMALLHLQDGHIDEAVKEMNRSLDITEGKHMVHQQMALRRIIDLEKRGKHAEAQREAKHMWYWIERGLGIPGMPVKLLNWWRVLEIQRRILDWSAALSQGDKAKATRAARTRGPVTYFERHLLRGMHSILFGQPQAAIRELRGLVRRPTPEEKVWSHTLKLTQSAGRVSQDISRMEQLAQKGNVSEGQVRSVVRGILGRATKDDTLHFRIFAQRLVDLVQRRKIATARALSRLGARLLHGLAKNRYEYPYTQAFRRRYGQVIAAKSQVDHAASLSGRVSRSRQYLKRRKPDVALRIADGALRRYGKKAVQALVVRGMALEQIGRLDEALTAYETYLKRAPKAANAERVRQRISQLQSR